MLSLLSILTLPLSALLKKQKECGRTVFGAEIWISLAREHMSMISLFIPAPVNIYMLTTKRATVSGRVLGWVPRRGLFLRVYT